MYITKINHLWKNENHSDIIHYFADFSVVLHEYIVDLMQQQAAFTMQCTRLFKICYR